MRLHPHELFKILGVSTRLKILQMLKSEGPIPVKTIAKRIGVTEAAVSQHLKALRHAGLVKSERKGYWIPYHVDQEALNSCCGVLMDVCRCHSNHDSCCEPNTKLDRETLVKMRDQLKNELEDVERRIEELAE